MHIRGGAPSPNGLMGGFEARGRWQTYYGCKVLIIITIVVGGSVLQARPCNFRLVPIYVPVYVQPHTGQTPVSASHLAVTNSVTNSAGCKQCTRICMLVSRFLHSQTPCVVQRTYAGTGASIRRLMTSSGARCHHQMAVHERDHNVVAS